MSGRIDFSGIVEKFREIASKLSKQFQNMDERESREENIENQNELLKEQISLVKWTRILAIRTLLLVIVNTYMAYIQAPMPNMKLNVWGPYPASCFNNISFPYGPEVQIANVGTRTSFNTQLFITYNEPNSFYDAYFIKYNRTVNRTIVENVTFITN